jgi:hypothetical protein
MFGAVASDTFLIALVNAALFALWAVPPALIIGYTRQTIAARRLRPDFSLQNLEAIELDRAILLYDKASSCLKEIERLGDDANASLWTRYRLRAQIKQQYGNERKDLETYTRHLRATIFRLRRLPIERIRCWVHTLSAHFAFGRSLTAYVVIMALLVAIFQFEHLTWVDEVRANLDTLLLWKPLDESVLYANWIAAVTGAAATPLLYFGRRAKLLSDHRQQIRNLKEFATTDPDQLIDQRQENRAEQEADQKSDQASAEPKAHEESAEQPAAFEAPIDNSWHVVLGVSRWATAEEVRQAYKAQIKQIHPDRVHGMSSIFRDLAEAETKRLNIAYEEALMSVRPFEFELNGGGSSHTRH